MVTKKMTGQSNRIHKYIKLYAQDFIFILITLIIATVLGYIAEGARHILVYQLLYVGLVWVAKFYKGKSVIKYICAASSVILFAFTSITFDVSYKETAYLAFYMPLLYTYLMPDIIFPNIVGLLMAYLFYTKKEQMPMHSLIAMMSGVITVTIAYTIIIYLVRKVTLERNRYYHKSITDELTGLFTLDYVINKGQEMIDQDVSISVYMIDLDNFKSINDTYGHLAGNKVLKQIGNLLKERVHGLNSIVGRFGGDEFIIILQNQPSYSSDDYKDQLCIFLNNSLLEADSQLDPIKIRYSIGGADLQTNNEKEIEDLIKIADLDMYQRKYENKIDKHTTENNKGSLEITLPKECDILLKTLQEKDMYTYIHSKYTAEYALLLARAIHLKAKDVKDIYIGAWMHDVGKLLIPNEILRKPTKLTDEEYNIIKKHARFSLSIIRNLPLSDKSKNTIMYHHERWDGRGYPFGIKGEHTPIEGRIIQIADAFSAMTIKRVYQNPKDIVDTTQELDNLAGHQFDAELVKIFIDIIQRNEEHVYDDGYELEEEYVS